MGLRRLGLKRAARNAVRDAKWYGLRAIVSDLWNGSEPPKEPRDPGDVRRALAEVGEASVGVTSRPIDYDDLERRVAAKEPIHLEEWIEAITHGPTDVELVPMDSAGNEMSQARVASANMASRSSGKPFWITHYTNPKQNVQYMISEAVMTGTFGALATGAFMRFVMGTGVRAELYLLNPSDDSLKDLEELKKYKWITDIMDAVDRRVGQTGPRTGEPVDAFGLPSTGSDATGSKRVLRQPFTSLVQSLIRSVICYNRGAVAITARKPITVGDLTVPDMPLEVQYVHPRDLGQIHVDQYGNLLGVQWEPKAMELEVDNMVYLWNSLQGEEKVRSKWYGLPMIEGCMSQLRTIFQVVTRDLAAASKASYAGAVIIPYNVERLNQEVRLRELDRVSRAIVPGGISVVAAPPESISAIPVNTRADITGITTALELQYKEVCACLGIPQSIVFDEAASNRATMVSKLIYVNGVTTRSIRAWANSEIAPQWYGVMLDGILKAAGKEDLGEVVGVRLKWDDIQVENSEDTVKFAAQLNALVGLTVEGILDLVNKPELINKIDPKKQQMVEQMGMMGPGGPGGAEGGGIWDDSKSDSSGDRWQETEG